MDMLPISDPSNLKPALEALLLVSTEAQDASYLSRFVGFPTEEVEQALIELSGEYQAENRGFQLREVAGGWRLFTHPAFHEQVERFILSWDTRKLSQAGLETLAVIAYNQPVTRDGVRAIRGVNSDGVIASLKEKGLVREMGKDPTRGNAATFGTTKLFLERFGLRSIKDLPPLEDFAPDEQSREFIRERLSGRSYAPTLEEAYDDLEDERQLFDEVDEGQEDYAVLASEEENNDD